MNQWLSKNLEKSEKKGTEKIQKIYEQSIETNTKNKTVLNEEELSRDRNNNKGT